MSDSEEIPANDPSPTIAFVRSLGAMILAPLLLFGFCVAGLWLPEKVDVLVNRRDFDSEVWRKDEYERKYMMHDVEDFLDAHPTREEVDSVLGETDLGNGWNLGEGGNMEPVTLKVRYDSASRVRSYEVSQY